ncbi:MAG TPA: preprotein translocase subunit Sec61beta [Candidatus Nanoarchaeia archaeon]|nr:preprotein translocase subunit Sec61beta [Candidatus Nanoarchaeia archaeon]
MASDNRVQMPSSMGGLVNYHEEYESKVMLKPEHIIIIIGIVIVLILLLHWQGSGFLNVA